jgi:hypothetical protein
MGGGSSDSQRGAECDPPPSMEIDAATATGSARGGAR